MQNESQSSKQVPEKDDAKDAVVSLIVSTPPAHSVEIANPTLKPQDGICNWCRNKPGDIFCDGWPCCFDCIEIQLDQIRGLAIADETDLGIKWRSEYHESLIPWGWERQ